MNFIILKMSETLTENTKKREECKLKRFLLLMTTLIITASILTGCGSSSSETEETKETQAAAKELDISTSTGDSLTIICQNTGEDTISFNKEVSAITYFNDDESAKAQALLLTEDLYKQYADSLKKSGTLIGPYEDNGVKTSLYSCKISGDDYYVYLGWITGSNTGIIFESTSSQDEAAEEFGRISFKVNKTEQKDESYVYTP